MKKINETTALFQLFSFHLIVLLAHETNHYYSDNKYNHAAQVRILSMNYTNTLLNIIVMFIHIQ